MAANPFETVRNRRSKKGVLGQRVKGSSRDVRAARLKWLSSKIREEEYRSSKLKDRRIDADLERFQRVRLGKRRRVEGGEEEDLPETFATSFEVENSEDVDELVERQRRARKDAEEAALAVQDVDKDFGELSALLGFRSGRTSRDDGDDYDTSLRQLALEKRARALPNQSKNASRSTRPYDKAREEYLSTARGKDLVEYFVVERLRDRLDLLAGEAAVACGRSRPELVCRCALEAVRPENVLLGEGAKLVGDLLVARLVTRLPPTDLAKSTARRLRLIILKAMSRSSFDDHLLARLALRDIDSYLEDEWTPEVGEFPELLSAPGDDAERPPPESLIPETKTYAAKDDLKDLKRKVKREHRAAMRELRKDADYTNAARAATKSVELARKREERQKNMAWLQTQRQRGWEG